MEISSNLPMSTNIPDSRRSVLSVCVSPLANLAAAVDCFGRVLLLDCETLVIRRMWKGSIILRLMECCKYIIKRRILGAITMGVHINVVQIVHVLYNSGTV